MTGTYQVQSIAEHGADEIVHTIKVEVCSSFIIYLTHHCSFKEEVAFANWINSNLSDDPDLKLHLPVNFGGDLYKKIQDGLVIW